LQGSGLSGLVVFATTKKKVKGDYGSCLLHFLLLTSMYVLSLISIPFVLSNIWLRQEIPYEKNGYGEINM